MFHQTKDSKDQKNARSSFEILSGDSRTIVNQPKCAHPLLSCPCGDMRLKEHITKRTTTLHKVGRWFFPFDFCLVRLCTYWPNGALVLTMFRSRLMRAVLAYLVATERCVRLACYPTACDNICPNPNSSPPPGWLHIACISMLSRSQHTTSRCRSSNPSAAGNGNCFT